MTQPDMVPLDTTDVDHWVGRPIGGNQPREPFSANDIRRFVVGMDNPNRLHFDEDYAAGGPYGGIVAPQSYFGGGPGTGATPSIQGAIPGSHMLFGGDEQWFYGPRVRPGDLLRMDRMLFDYRVTDTSFAGPTMFARGDTTYVNQRGELIGKQRSTSIRYLAENARRLGAFSGQEKEPEWTDEQLAKVLDERVAWIRSWPGGSKRLWADVEVGEEMTKRVIGPHSVQTFTTESRTDQGGWGSYLHWPPLPSSTMDAGWLPEMSQDRERAKLDPAASDGLVYGPSRGHVQARWAQVIGMPRGYGYGATMCAWVVDYLANWAGDHGFVLHHRTQYRNPALTGNLTYLSGTINDKWRDDEFDRSVVQATYEMRTHEGAVMAKGQAEIQLPER